MKDCLVSEYKYTVLIENIPNCISQKRLLGIAQDIIRDNTNKPFYTMANCQYVPNPMIADDNIYFSDYELTHDPKAFPESAINFKIDYRQLS